jgi:aminomethyltransferase
MSASPVNLRKTPLTEWHRAHGGLMVPFAGWEMPASYAPTGIGAEHLAVRERAGLFDVTHMGELEVAGKDALAALQQLTSNDVAALHTGQAQYSALTTPDGRFVDDLLIYRLGQEHFLLVVNASNTRKDALWLVEQARAFGDAAVVDTSSRYALLALQGPAARDILQDLTGVVLEDLRYYWFTYGEVAGVRATISRTGYTGEPGYEVFVPPQQALHVWQALLEAGREAGVVPAGLGARDTLRLEAGMRLYGSDIDDTTSVLEADLEWIVAWGKGPFTGREALAAQKAAGVTRRLVGFEMVDRAIARPGCDVLVDGNVAGRVTSGTQTPFVKRAVGMAYVPIGQAAPGTEFEVDVRGRRARARVVPLPFYKRPKG